MQKSSQPRYSDCGLMVPVACWGEKHAARGLQGWWAALLAQNVARTVTCKLGFPRLIVMECTAINARHAPDQHPVHISLSNTPVWNLTSMLYPSISTQTRLSNSVVHVWVRTHQYSSQLSAAQSGLSKFHWLHIKYWLHMGPEPRRSLSA